MKLKSSVLTRRDLHHSGSGVALNWPMCPDRHPGILELLSYFATKLIKIGTVGKEMWPGKPSKKSPGAGVAMRESVSVRGFDSRPYRPVSGPEGSIRHHFPIFGSIAADRAKWISLGHLRKLIS